MKQREQCMKDKYLYCVGWEAGKHGKHGNSLYVDAWADGFACAIGAEGKDGGL